MGRGRHHKKVNYARRGATVLVVVSLGMTTWYAVRITPWNVPTASAAHASATLTVSPTSDYPSVFRGPLRPSQGAPISSVPVEATTPPVQTSTTTEAAPEPSTASRTPPPTTTTRTRTPAPTTTTPPPADTVDNTMECRSVQDLGLREHAALAIADIVSATGFDGVLGGYAQRPNNPTSDHPRRLAVDLMTSSRTMGDAIEAYAERHAARLAVKYVLWQVADHYDHVHISFEDSPGAEFDPNCN